MDRAKFRRIMRRFRHKVWTILLLLLLGSMRLLPKGVLFFLLPKLATLLLRPFVSSVSMENLGIAFPEASKKEKKLIIRRMCRNVGFLMAELLALDKYGKKYIKECMIEGDGREKIGKILAQGKGLIILTGHFGNWELLAQWGATVYSAPLAVVGKKLHLPALEERLQKFRTKAGLEVFDRDDPPRRMLRHLRRPGILGIVPDQDMDNLAGEFLPFFGKPAYTPTGPAALCITSGAPILPVFAIRSEKGFSVYVESPIYPDKKADRREELLRITQAWSLTIEKMLRQHPDHWLWWHRRWSSTPEKVARKRQRHLEKRIKRAQAALEKKHG